MRSFSLFYKEVGGNEGDKCVYPLRLDTYGCGCQHDCSYCYAKSLLSFRGLWKPEKPVVRKYETNTQCDKKNTKRNDCKAGWYDRLFATTRIKIQGYISNNKIIK